MNSTLHIFPSMAATEAHNRLLLKDRQVLAGYPALTLRRLAEELALPARTGLRLLSPVGRRLLLRDLVSHRYSADTGWFAPLHRFPGFIAAAGSWIGEMKQALVSPGELLHVSRHLPQPEKVMELAALYKQYQDVLVKKKLMDQHDVEAQAVRNVSSGAVIPLLQGVGVVHFHDVYDFTPRQISLITALARKLPVVVEFPYRFDNEILSAYVARTVETFESLDDSDLRIELRFGEGNAGFLSPLLPQLFSATRGVFSPAEGEIAAFAAPGPYRECEEIGRRIRRLIEGGADPSSIAVLLRTTDGYAPIMEEVCRRFRVPVSFRRGAPLFTAQLVRTSLLPLEIVGRNYERELLLSLLKSSYFPHLRDAEGDIHPDQFEELLLQAQYMDGALEPLKKRVSRWIAARKSEGRQYRNEERLLAALLPLLNDISAFDGQRGMLEYASLLDSFIDKYGIYRRGIAGGDQRMLKGDASAITLFQRVMKGLHDDLATLGMENNLFTPSEFLELLRQGMSEEFLAGERGEGVKILNFHDARGLVFEHLFIAGLNEGKCPVRHDGDPLFKDEEKVLFHRLSGRRCFRTAAEKGLEEPLLFYLALSTAGKSASLSYSYADASGNVMLPSSYFAEVLGRLAVAESRLPASPMTPVPEACLDEEELVNSAASRHIAADLLPPPIQDRLAEVSSIVAIEEQRELFFREGDATRRSSVSDSYTGSIRRPDLAKEVRAAFGTPPGNVFTATALESYGTCPFRFFLDRVVRISTQEKPELELAPTEEGTLIHLVLQRFFSRCARENRLPLRGTDEEKLLAREEAAAVFARWEKGMFTGEATLWEIEKQKILSILDCVIATEGDDASPLIPCTFETPFSDLEIEPLQGEPLFLRGKIDRVDADPSGGQLRVVDYKMGGSTQVYAGKLKKGAMGETSFQVPVYLLAAAQELERLYGSRFHSFMARYWLLRRGECCDKDFAGGKEDFSGFFISEMERRKELGDENFFNRLCRKVEAIRDGDFQITPREGCDFCGYQSVCRHMGDGIEDGE